MKATTSTLDHVGDIASTCFWIGAKERFREQRAGSDTLNHHCTQNRLFELLAKLKQPLHSTHRQHGCVFAADILAARRSGLTPCSQGGCGTVPRISGPGETDGASPHLGSVLWQASPAGLG
jgi:hypothetical protein